MPRKTHEDHVRLTAARSGLKLITNRHSLTSTGKKTYCLRPLWDARCVVGTLSDGGLGLVKTSGKGRRRQKVASWLPLKAVEQILPEWRGARGRQGTEVGMVAGTAIATRSPNLSLARSAL
jgi:hypothetical protein